MDSKPVKLLTFNCWGLKYVSKLRRPRLRAIAEKLAHTDHDVVALQEIWVEEDWQYIEETCLAKFPHRRFFKSGIVAGPGLALLLRVPIESTFLYRFPINGRPSAFFRGDWLVGKSIAVTILGSHVPGARQLAVLNSHMHAPYKQHGDASYSTHRACQAWDLLKLVKVLQRAGYAVVQVGDLNSKPGSLPHKLFTQEGGLSDSWELLHGENTLPNDEIALLSPHEQITRGGITCDSRLNTWRAHREPWEACRLDYALIDRRALTPVAAEVLFTDLLKAPYSCSYSDHFAYSVTLHLKDQQYLEPVASKTELAKLYGETLSELQTYIDHTIPFQSNWRKLHFFASLVAVVVILVGIAFASAVQPWVSVLLALASTLIAVTGVVNGMICFLGVRSEKRALLEVKMEVEDSLRGIQRGTS
ncbi:DNase I-like protein [Metschnikowia bicuspidata var. bicuspidata NRRL YB-4993]|uniref:DNase I-like protein n=1 Tax=Metschnikowia bicuspidata var. bicuspidata NRRL YB-4993 TaxID=869754 RepID=A0A1A0HGC8_9ASCO|nr:DNase I-like protein [Metschnikowia bicuspidata var. bicuspidata NRRL YB-4993]OBA23219.1 DNase I-like protein [Metschnikowia bicuspidata var. bicuspidata NRRL YB-4993]